MEEQITTPIPGSKPSSDKLFKISLIIIGLLIVLGLFLNAYLLLKKEKTSKISTPIPTATPTIDPTANWKVYINEKYRFEFRYPPISEPEEYQSKEAYYIPIVSIELSMSRKLPTQEQTPPEKISLSAIENIDIYENMPIDLIAQREVGDGGVKYAIKKTSINNYETAQVDLESDNDNLKYYIKSPDKNLIIVVTSSSKSKDLINQILSTFKFLP